MRQVNIAEWFHLSVLYSDVALLNTLAVINLMPGHEECCVLEQSLRGLSMEEIAFFLVKYISKNIQKITVIIRLGD